MQGVNKVILLGNLGADPELKFTESGQSVMNISVATTETYLDKNKERKEVTDWHRVAVWGKRGEALSKILAKGSQVYIEGSIRHSSYENKDGVKRYNTTVIAKEVVLIGGRGGNGEDQSQRSDRERRSKGSGPAAKPAASPKASSAENVAPDIDLDGKWGDPIIRYDPRNWKGRSYVGAHYSQTEPAYLDMVAENLEWRANNPKQGKEQYVENDRRDASKARGWAQRLRAQGMGGDGPGVGIHHGFDGKAEVPEDEYDMYGSDDDIPF